MISIQQTIFTAIFLLIICAAMWYPGFMMSVNMVKAVEHRNPTAGEYVLSCIPGLNLAVGRTVLYGTAKIVYIPAAITVFAVVQRFIMYFLFDEAILLSFISLLFTWLVFIVAWLISGYVLWDMATCAQCSIATKILAFVFPILAMFNIGKNVLIVAEELDED